MRLSALLLSGLCLAYAATDAQAVRVRFLGEATITGRSAACASDLIGEFGRVRFIPGIGGDNPNFSAFSTYGSDGADSYLLNPGLFTSTFKTVQTMLVGDDFGPAANVVRVRFTSQIPATITQLTDFIDIRGQISGYDETPLCTITFKMTLFKRVE